MTASVARVLPNRPPIGVGFLEHTADTAIEVRAPSLEACFARAAAGMFAVFVGPAGIGAPMQSVGLDVTASTASELLVAWLEELLYLSEVKGLALQAFTAAEASQNRVIGFAEGARFGPDSITLGPVVKGISRHDLQLHRTRAGWLARVIFDV